MKRILTIVFALVCFGASAQTYQEIRANRVLVNNVLRPVMDTIPLNVRDSGALAHKNGRIWVWNGFKWNSSSSQFSDYFDYDIPYNGYLRFGKIGKWEFSQYANTATVGGGVYMYYNDSLGGYTTVQIAKKAKSDSAGFFETYTFGTIDGQVRATRFTQTPDLFFLDGMIRYQGSNTSSADIDLTNLNSPYIRLLSISGVNRTVKMPPPRFGHRYTISNQANHATLRYSFGGGGGTVKDLSGATVTTMDNLTTYELFGTTAEWLILSKYTVGAGGGSGTVTSVGSGFGLTGGPITTSGTLQADSASMATRARVQKGIDSLGALIGGGGGSSLSGAGTYAARPSSPATGYRYYQTNYIRGSYVYNGTAWDYLPDHNTTVFENFQGTGAGNSSIPPANFTSTVSGTGAATGRSNSSTGENTSLWNVQAGTTTTGRAAITVQSSNSMTSSQLISGDIYGAFGVTMSALSDGTDTYTVYAGIMDIVTAEPTNGVYFKYTHSLNSGNWTAVCASGGTRTEVNCGDAAGLRGTDYDNLVINYTPSSVEFWIDAVLVATITTNVPAAGTGASWGLNIIKSAGTNNRFVLIKSALSVKGSITGVTF